jgi:hypothetical protein
MVTADSPKSHRIARMFAAGARPLSIIFPALVFVTLVMSLFGFRIADPYVEIGFAVILYILSVFYFGGLFSTNNTILGLALLFAVPLMLFFVSIRVYWPIILASLPAINKAFRERDKDHAGRIVSFVMAAVLIVGFVPAAILSCDAYNSEHVVKMQSVSPDGTHTVEVSVVTDTDLGGKGKAVLYEIYPFFLQRQERPLAYFTWVNLDKVRQADGFIKPVVSMDLHWQGDHTIVMGDYTMDVYKDPLINETQDTGDADPGVSPVIINYLNR